MKKTFLSLVFPVLVAAALSAQGHSGEAGKLDIVTTLFPQYDFARIIGGDKVNVKILLPSGSDPHAFDPRPSDLEAIAKTDLFVYTGEEMEPWAAKVIDALKDSGRARAVDLSVGIRLLRSSEWNDEDDPHAHAEEHHGERGEEEHGEHGEHDADEDHDEEDHDDHEEGDDGHGHGEHGHVHFLDPHVWLDPVLAMSMVDSLFAAMCEADPANAAQYAANVSGLKNDLRAIDAECRAMVAGAKRRTLVFGGRFAFAYFTERYGLEHFGAYDNCGAGAEPSVRRVMEVIDYVKKNGIPVIYHEERSEPRISMGIADATGCRMMVAHSLHNLSDEEFASGLTFVELMRRNVAAFAEGLE